MELDETLRIRRLMVDYYSDSLAEELRDVIESKGYLPKDIDNILNDAS